MPPECSGSGGTRFDGEGRRSSVIMRTCGLVASLFSAIVVFLFGYAGSRRQLMDTERFGQ